MTHLFDNRSGFLLHPHDALVEVTAPAEEPVSLAEMRLHLRVDSDVTADDALISSLIVAARQWCETYTGRAFVTQTWDYFLDAFPPANYSAHISEFPRGDVIEAPKPELQSVTTLKYIDTDGTQQTLSEGTDYSVDANSKPGRVEPFYGTVWPNTRNVSNAVEMRFVCGYGDASDVPDGIKEAIKVTVASWYARREDLSSCTANDLGIAKKLLWSFRLRDFR